MSEYDARKAAEAIIDDSRKGVCGGCGASINESLLAANIAVALTAAVAAERENQKAVRTHALVALEESHREQIAAEREKWKAFAGPDGEPRKVLGTLPVTADGFIVGVDAEALWFIDRYAHKDTLTGKYQSQVKATTWSVDRGRFEFVDRDGWEEFCDPSECYSTKEAAESAAGRKK